MFIEVRASSTKRKQLVNTEDISTIYPSSLGGTEILYKDSATLRVEESYIEIKQRLVQGGLLL